jgi:DNA-binding transcriptional LysR family regulator
MAAGLSSGDGAEQIEPLAATAGAGVKRKTDLRSAQATLALGDLRLLLRVADSRSFSATARALGLPVSTVSRAVARIEAGLGRKLFRRTTHGLSVTDAGSDYLRHVAQWLRAEDALRARWRDGARERGRLRVTVPVFVAERVLPTVLAEVLARHPEARIELQASDERSDLIRDGFDLALRLGPLPDSTFKARRIASFSRATVASRAFIERHAALRTPEALAALPCLIYGGSGRVVWMFRHRNGRRVEVEVDGPVRSLNLALLLELAASGLGVARLPDWVAAEALAARRVVPLLADWSHPTPSELPSLHALFPDDPGTARLRNAFLAALDAAVRRGPAALTRSR